MTESERILRNRFIALTVAGAMLNVGFYFILYIFTSMLTGAIIGFLLRNRKRGTLSGFVSALIAFIPLFLVTDVLGQQLGDISAILVAAGILSLLGAFGGYAGALLSSSLKRMQVEGIA